MAQQMDDVIDRQPETNCDENRRAHSEEQLRRLRIASASVAASSGRGSTIFGLFDLRAAFRRLRMDCDPLSRLAEYYGLAEISDRDGMRVADVSNK